MARFLNCIYAWCAARIPPDKREEWDRMLLTPLPHQTKKKAADALRDGEDSGFMDLLATKRGDR